MIRLTILLAVGALCVGSSLASADDANCSAVASTEARQECLRHKYDNTPDCGKFANSEARRECAEYKAENGGNNGTEVDCGKLDSPEARRECVRRKTK
jgi:hypothetical protein